MIQFNAHQVLTTAKFSDVAVTPGFCKLLLLQLLVYDKSDGPQVLCAPPVIST